MTSGESSPPQSDGNPNSTPQTLLGFDYGFKRIGVAIGHEITGQARPLATLVLKNKQIPWDNITRLIEEWAPGALVVGMPLNADQSEHEVSKAARRFGNQLNGRYNLPVYWVDERLTSHAAEQLLREPPLPGKNSSATTDSVAAQLILESWLQNPASHQ